MKTSTRDKLLDVAERLFAERGFDGVSVREITAEANCNVSSVHYYFGNKKGLYLAVFRERLAVRVIALKESFRQRFQASPKDLRALIYSLVSAYLEGPFSEEQRRRHHKLLSREVQQPTEASKFMIKEVFEPFFDEVKGHIRKLTGDRFSEEQLRLRTMAIFGVLLHFSLSGPMLKHLFGSVRSGAFREKLKEEVTEFCLKGLQG